MQYAILPDNFNTLSPMEQWVYLKRVEKEIKEELKLLELDAKGYTSDNHEGFFKNEYGSVTVVHKTTRKPKEELKLYLADNDVLELCMKDEIDLNKVKEMVDAGILEEEAVERLLDVRKTSYLKFK